MSDPIKSSARLSALVVAEGSPVTSKQIDNHARLMEIDQQDRKINAILNAWNAQESHYRVSRQKYADRIISGLLIQAVLVNVAFFLIGFGCITVQVWVANSFIIGVFSEMAALSLIVFKYFFPSSPSDIGKLVEKL
jgi:hypothetical protein